MNPFAINHRPYRLRLHVHRCQAFTTIIQFYRPLIASCMRTLLASDTQFHRTIKNTESADHGILCRTRYCIIIIFYLSKFSAIINQTRWTRVYRQFCVCVFFLRSTCTHRDHRILYAMLCYVMHIAIVPIPSECHALAFVRYDALQCDVMWCDDRVLESPFFIAFNIHYEFLMILILWETRTQKLNEFVIGSVRFSPPFWWTHKNKIRFISASDIQLNETADQQRTTRFYYSNFINNSLWNPHYESKKRSPWIIN